MNVDSGVLLHLGISYVLTPPPSLDKRQFLAFQNALMDEGIEYGEAKHNSIEINLARKSPPLHIRVIRPNQPVGHLAIISPRPEEWLDMFARQAESITTAFSKTWTGPRQIVACESTIRYLYESSRNHAFEEIWEDRLHQTKDALKAFGAPVGGGGLRFVMPALQNNDLPIEREVKLESFLQNPKQLYIDVRFKWPRLNNAQNEFQPGYYLQQVDTYIDNNVIPFLNNSPWLDLNLE